MNTITLAVTKKSFDYVKATANQNERQLFSNYNLNFLLSLHVLPFDGSYCMRHRGVCPAGGHQPGQDLHSGRPVPVGQPGFTTMRSCDW